MVVTFGGDQSSMGLASPSEGWREQASALVDRWDATWLLIESVARRHRGEAREALVEAIAGALAAAAAQGVDDQIDLDF